MDYRELGLRVGFEIHQELETHKLFCSCPSRLEEKSSFLIVKRRLRPTQSELGDVDRAAIAEALKGKGFSYEVDPEGVCLVELDEEPPHPLNLEALKVALQVSLMLGAKPVDEIHVMRKIVIDGSNTSGFQRTALVATDGEVEFEGMKFRVPTVCLEEDAARKTGETEGEIVYRLDRLGIPLIEIATGPDFSDPREAQRAALYLGQLLRMTGRVKRGIGTIRQDVNISIASGARQEIKGVQKLELISTVIEREVQRQLALLKIAKELQRRGARVGSWLEVSDALRQSPCRLVKRALEAGGVILALRLEGFAGLLGEEIQPGRRLGTELSDHARAMGVGGLLHSDELPGYGITAEEVDALRKLLQLGELDAFVLIAGERAKAEQAILAVARRAEQAIQGVPEETRRALPDGNTEYMRPLPGAGRMYPETDIPPVPVERSWLSLPLPERPEERVERLVRECGLGREMAWRLALSERLELFEKLSKLADPHLVAFTLEETLVSLKREGCETERLEERTFVELFSALKGGLAKEAIPEILRLACRGLSVEEAIKQLGLKPMRVEELEELVHRILEEKRELVAERGEAALKPLMGVVMEKVRGRVDGKMVREVLERELKKLLSG
ncbi:MAG: Glu-tRNA(Gln) amidotransferase subunit GatE [Candidatus Hadarchaeales archaeon]